MSDITDPTAHHDVPEDERLDYDEDPDLEGIEDLSAYRNELRGEVIELEGWGLESVGGGFAPYEESTSPCSGGPTPGANALVAYLEDRFPVTSNGGVYVCKNVAGSNTPSQHSEGRALDLMVPTNAGKARPELGDPIVDLLRSQGKALGIQLIIYNRRKWGAAYPDGKYYGAPPPHYNHIHVSLSRHAAATLNYATIEALLGGTGAGPTPEVEGITHHVDTQVSGLNVRSQATTSGSIIANLPKGTQVAVQSDAPQQADSHQWVRIKAGHRGRIIEGWVADDFLAAVGGPATSQPTTPDTSTSRDGEAATPSDGATHRVNTREDDLRMRSEPTTSSGDNIIVELPKGTEVTALPDAARESDGHTWLKVRATLDGRTHEGWVAEDLLERIG